MRETMKELEGLSFFQCNKGYLVNLEFVDAITGNEVKVGDEYLLVSRAKKKPLIDALNEYMRRMGD